MLTPAELEATNPAPGTAAELATVAYNQTLATRRQWATETTGAVPASIASKLPELARTEPLMFSQGSRYLSAGPALPGVAA